MLPNQLLYFGPLIEKEAQVTDEISRALSFSDSANDNADSLGILSSRKILRRRSRSLGSSIFREIPLRSLNGMRTKYRPAKLRLVVTRGPFVPIGPFVTW